VASQPVTELLSLPRRSSGQAQVLLEPEFIIPESGIVTAAPAALIAWAQRARPMEACIYARANMLPRWGCAVAATARMLSDAGILMLSQSRPHALLPFHYLARRTHKPMVLDAPKRPARLDEPLPLTPEQIRVLEHLHALADAGDPCPSNSAIALRLGIGDRSAVASALARLERLGLIRREQDAGFNRVIRIVETGASTGARGPCL
jgi:DNA-binding MarR family transcriptional regulator